MDEPGEGSSPEKAGRDSASDEVPLFAAAATPGPVLGAAQPPNAAPEAADGEGNGASTEAAAEDAEGQEESDLTGTGRKDSSLLPPSAKKMKIETKERKEKNHKVDEDEIQKMQILVSSFSEEQLNRYEMYRRSAFPKAAIKREVKLLKGRALPSPRNQRRSGQRDIATLPSSFSAAHQAVDYRIFTFSSLRKSLLSSLNTGHWRSHGRQ
ncbi:transcription initiation factor TFIID subunit 11 isoform X4 [Phascolarctos cinereus]|uniref:Transcription initiation factor TFIID subunit 11 isoform X4 n=1 Tax=Phascolarctos cinereus TaxID=38626 RepID=A0A6P5LAM3_PHACI|nr:transcription initiation factor TFIID subunit 11 isoform X4 [Phascolarctos cinereus]